MGTYIERVGRYRVFLRTTSKPHLEAGAGWGLHYSSDDEKVANEMAAEVDTEFDSVKVVDNGESSFIERENW